MNSQLKGRGVCELVVRTITCAIAVAGCVVIAFATVKLTATQDADAQGRSAAVALLEDIGRSLRVDIARTVEPAIERTQKLAASRDVVEALRSGNEQRLIELCNRAIVGSTEVDAVALFNRSGEIVALNTVYSTGDPIAQDRVDRILKKDFSNRDIITRCVLNDADERVLEFQTQCDITPAFFESVGLAIAYSTPVFDPRTREKLGVVSTRLRFERLTRLLENRALSGNRGSMHFINDGGYYFSETIISGKEEPPIAEGTLAGLVGPLTVGAADSTFTRVGDHYASIFRLTNFTTLEGGGIQVLLLANEDWLLAELRQVQMLRSGLLWLLGALLLLISVLGRYVLRLRRHEAALVHAHEAAEAATQAKTEFLGNMSHEIRTPMTAILGYADLLMDSNQTSEQRVECINIIRRNGQHLLMIINDILDISKIEAGKLETERVPCSPAVICEEVFSLMNVRAVDKGIKFTADYDKSIHWIHSDPLRLRQILMNLVGNAIKFTDQGSVTLRASAQPKSDDGFIEVTISVEDTGIGMSPVQLAKLFDRFEQADTSTTRRFGGSGLGLVISKRLTEILGGDIQVHSSIGVGSRFTIRLIAPPATPAHSDRTHHGQKAADEAVAIALSGRILLAEDGVDNQRLVCFHLKRAGAEVVVAQNGREAVDTALAAARDGQPFDLILMDIQMPVLDGYGATALLRRSGCETPIVALTAHAMGEDRERCLVSGFNDYATKPIDRTLLLNVCSIWMSKRTVLDLQRVAA